MKGHLWLPRFGPIDDRGRGSDESDRLKNCREKDNPPSAKALAHSQSYHQNALFDKHSYITHHLVRRFSIRS